MLCNACSNTKRCCVHPGEEDVPRRGAKARREAAQLSEIEQLLECQGEMLELMRELQADKEWNGKEIAELREEVRRGRIGLAKFKDLVKRSTNRGGRGGRGGRSGRTA